MKKVVSILMSILLVMSMMVFVSADEVAQASISSASAGRGETVELTVTLSGAPAVSAGGFTVSYDENVLELVSGTWSISALMADFNPQTKQGVFAAMSAIDINGTPLTLTFKVKDDAAFGETVVSGAWERIGDVSCTDGIITVACSHADAAAKAEIPSTCTTQGYAAGTYCPGCETYLDGGELLPLAAHTYGEWSSDGDATHTHTCTVCLTDKETADHVFGEWVNNGENHKKTCDACGYFATEAHTFGEWVKADDNTHKRTCPCGAAETGAHEWSADWSDKGDNHGKICSICSAEKTATHTFGDWISVNNDKHSHTCADCGKVVEAEHNIGEWVDNGDNHKKTCADCGYFATEAHTFTEWAKVDDNNHKRTCPCGAVETGAHEWSADWSDKGDNHGKTCSICSAEKTAAHNFDGWTSVDNDKHSHTCADCGKVVEAEHNIGEWVDNGDNHKKTCADCGYFATEAHTFTEWAKVDDNNHKRTCPCGAVETGAHEWSADWSDKGDNHGKTCSICSAEKTAAHNFSDWTKIDADKHSRTCADCGKVVEVAHTYDNACDTTCNDCDHTRTIEHNYQTQWTKDASGHWYACSVCGDKKDFAAHTPGQAATEYTNQSCTICHYIIVYAYGHTHSMTKIEGVAATCTESGKIEFYHCTGCGVDFKDAKGSQRINNDSDKIIPATGHTEVVDAAVEATCTETGLTEGKHCSACNEVLVAQKTVEAKGHTLVADAAVEATCDTDGKTAGEHCSACGFVSVAQQTIPATGHTYGGWTAAADGKHTRECACGGKETEECAWNAGVITTEATYEAEGVKTYTCSVCGNTKTETIAKLEKVTEIVTPDEDIKITIDENSTASLPENTVVEVEEIVDQIVEEVVTNIQEVVTNKAAEVLAAYDISLVADGAKVQPGGKVEVTLPAPENAGIFAKLQVVFVDDDGKVTLCETTVNADGSVTFVTDHFSYYAIIGVPAEETNNTIVIIVIAAVVVAAGALAAIVISKKKKKNA